MIVVVADTSPLNYLIRIHCDELLPALYEHVWVPAAVIAELDQPRTLAVVRDWITRLPSWLIVEDVDEVDDERFTRLHPGERQAIQLAARRHADLLLMDERLGVRLARDQGLAVTGTLGVLVQAARRGLVDLERALTELQRTDFRCSPRVIEDVRQRGTSST